MCSNLHMQESWPKVPVEQQHLRRLRQTVPVSVGELAEAAGCSPGHLRRIETTTYRPSPELATRLAHALTKFLGRPVSTSEFLTPDGTATGRARSVA